MASAVASSPPDSSVLRRLRVIRFQLRLRLDPVLASHQGNKITDEELRTLLTRVGESGEINQELLERIERRLKS